MATVGEILQDTRKGKNLTLEQVEKAIKIRASFLKHLEEGNYRALPSSAYARGFVKNYAEFLGLPTESLLARLRRELDERRLGVLPKRIDVSKDISGTRLRVTGLFLLFAALIVLLLSYLFFQYKGFLGTPSLTIDVPKEQTVVKSDTVIVLGKTDPEATVKVNNEIVEVGPDGKFQEKLAAFKGSFTITVVATNRFGRQTTQSRTITVE